MPKSRKRAITLPRPLAADAQQLFDARQNNPADAGRTLIAHEVAITRRHRCRRAEVHMEVISRVFRAALAILALTAAVGWPSGVYAQDIAHGRSLFIDSCKSCHGRPENNVHLIVEHGGNNPVGIVTAWIKNPMWMVDFLSWPSQDVLDVAAYLGMFLDVRPAPVIEYYHAAFDHYFVTSSADEIAKLDEGTIAGWARTGKQFNAYPRMDADPSLVGVCRFFSTAFGPKSSHFYAPVGRECDAVTRNADWTFEGETFIVEVPDDTGTANCPIGTQPVYRLYNNGQGGAPNHRYTMEKSVRDEMLAKGYVPEGKGPLGIVMCSPSWEIAPPAVP
jgi:hypothetical protein